MRNRQKNRLEKMNEKDAYLGANCYVMDTAVKKKDFMKV